MKTESTIEPSLFDLLEEVALLLGPDSPEKNETLRMHNVVQKLRIFLKEFLLQFFRNGYGLDIKGVNDTDLKKIKKHFRFKFNSPKIMIQIFEKTIETINRLLIAIYHDPPKEQDIIDLYEEWIPKVLKGFQEEGKEIQNFQLVVDRINTLKLMNA